jgi:hypothetical protein
LATERDFDCDVDKSPPSSSPARQQSPNSTPSLSTMMFFSYTLFITILSLLSICSALPEPAAVFQQQHPHQVGFVIPPPPSPPYGKSLPASTYSSSRTWGWTQWLTDARDSFKTLFGSNSKSRHTPDDPDGNSRRATFDNDIVLRVNVSSLSDRIAITELANVYPRGAVDNRV